MSNAVFPELAGRTWNITKEPIWSTRIKTASNGREQRASYFSYPRYRIKLSYEFLRARLGYDEYQQLIGFFNQRQGSFDDFLLDFPNDNTVSTPQTIGTWSSGLQQMQLVREQGNFVEPVFGVKNTPTLYANGSALGSWAYTIDTYGLVTFANTGFAGQVITWQGEFYHRVRFEKDSTQFRQFLSQLWDNNSITFMSYKR